jgi:hypothetical protein
MSIPTWSPNPLYRDAPAPVIAFKEKWSSGEWQDQPFLYCDSFTQCSNPEIPQAVLSWRYGMLLRPAAQTYQQVDPLDGPSLLGQFVRITLTDPAGTAATVIWYGVIESITDEQQGTFANLVDPNAGPVSCGRQVVQCLGLESLLQKRWVVFSVVQKSSDQKEINVERGIQFNDVKFQKEFGNKSPNDGTHGAPLFGDDLSTAEFWSTDNILNYLLAYFGPGAPAINWQLSEASDNANFYFDKPRLTSDRRTLKSLLDTLIDRRRLIGYYVAPDANEGNIEINMFTFTATDISFGVETITANANQTAIEISGSPDVDRQVLRIVAADRYDQIKAIGAQAVGCCSLSNMDETLKPQWSADDAQDYNTAASTQPDYPITIDPNSILEAQARNTNWREEDRLKRVYAYYGLDRDWNGMVGDGEAGGDTNPYLPEDDDVDTPRPFYWPGLRFDHQLPLLLSHDYSGQNVATSSVTDSAPPGQMPEYLPCFAVGKIPKTGQTEWTDHWQFLETFACNADLELYNAEWSVSVRPQEDGPGIVLRPSGAPRWAIVNQDFVPLTDGTDSDFVNNAVPTIDWGSQIIVTVAIRADAPCQALWPADSGDAEFPKQLIIDLGAEAQWHYVAPHTVVGVKDGKLIRSDSGGSIRDDRDRLKTIAQFAYSWYSQPRQVLELSFNLCVFGLSVGQLITNLHDSIQDPPIDTTINTVITRIHREFPEASGGHPPPAPRTHITTQMGQLDGLYRDRLAR